MLRVSSGKQVGHAPPAEKGNGQYENNERID